MLQGHKSHCFYKGVILALNPQLLLLTWPSPLKSLYIFQPKHCAWTCAWKDPLEPHFIISDNEIILLSNFPLK